MMAWTFDAYKMRCSQLESACTCVYKLAIPEYEVRPSASRKNKPARHAPFLFVIRHDRALTQ